MSAHIVELNRQDGCKLLDDAARRKLQMTGEEFLSAYDRGLLDSTDPAVLEVEILIPFAR